MADTPDELPTLPAMSPVLTSVNLDETELSQTTAISPDNPVAPLPHIDPQSPARESVLPQFERDDQYYLEFAEFLVEDQLFHIPKYQFDKQPSLFWESIETTTNGRMDGDAIRLEGIRKVDFTALLKFLYPDVMDNSEPESFDEWKSILDLTFKWGMHKFFDVAMEALKKAPLPEQVLLAQKYGVYDWLKSAYTGLAKRDAFLSHEEATLLGLKAALKLFNLREKHYRSLASISGLFGLSVHEHTMSEQLQCKRGSEISKELEKLRRLKRSTIVDQIVIGREYGLAQWVERGYQKLLTRSESISFDEGFALGLDITVDLCDMREVGLRQKNSDFVTGIDIAAEVLVQFEEELKGLEQINGTYGRHPKTTPSPQPTASPQPATPSQAESQPPKGGKKKKKGKK